MENDVLVTGPASRRRQVSLTVAVAAAVASSALAGGLTWAALDRDPDPAPAATADRPAADPTAAPEPALRILPRRKELTCAEARTREPIDWGLFESSYVARAAARKIRVELINPRGAEIVGRVIDLPPVNEGGTFLISGAYEWATVSDLADDGNFRWAGRAPLGRAWPNTSGMALLHVRFTDEAGPVAGFDGYRWTWLTRDGEEQSAESPVATRVRYEGRC